MGIDYPVGMADPIKITPCPAADRPEALRWLHDSLPEDQRETFVQTLNATTSQAEDAFSGLIWAVDSQGLQGVVWVQLTPGSTAVVWPPGSSCRVIELLLRAAASFLDEQQVVLAQILVSPDSPAEPEVLSAGGFRELANLAYLTVDQKFFPGSQPGSDLQFFSQASNDSDRLGKLLLETYEDTKDCPELNGIRQLPEVLEGYRSQGIFSPKHWFFIQDEGQDIGTLILTEHAKGGTWELTYMGVTPSGRGKGLGWQIVQFALWKAGSGGAERLVLAVDEANEPALAVYRRAGFIVWDRRTVFARLCSLPGEDCC